MNNHLPKIKTIRVMLQEMGEQQQAVFRMAFKMHNTTNYVIVSPDSDEKPDLVLVDTDTPAGVEAWKESKKTYPEVPVAMFSSELPTVTTPYLAKPVKFDTLFPVLRSLAQGGNVLSRLNNKRLKRIKDNQILMAQEKPPFADLIQIKACWVR